LLSFIQIRRDLLLRQYREAVGIGPHEHVQPGLPAARMIQAILDKEFPVQAPTASC
jgi:hypothetical protein